MYFIDDRFEKFTNDFCCRIERQKCVVKLHHLRARDCFGLSDYHARVYPINFTCKTLGDKLHETRPRAGLIYRQRRAYSGTTILLIV